jgi:ribokinase
MSVCVVGAINLDLVARVAALPQRGETILAASLNRYPGGKGANQAVASARAGAATRMIGRVGADEAGDWLVGFLEQAGVDATGVARDADAPTGQAFITVGDDAENCIVVIPGANAALSTADASRAVVGDARVLLAQLETALAPVADLFTADLPGCLKVLNAAPALAEGATLFPYCDVLILNETELAAYAGMGVSDDIATVVAAARNLLAKPAQHIVVTLGAEGALIVSADGEFHAPARPAQVVDTVGAGDCFCGVLAAGLDEGLSLQAAVLRGNTAAALAVARPGAANAMPTRAEIDAAE